MRGYSLVFQDSEKKEINFRLDDHHNWTIKNPIAERLATRIEGCGNYGWMVLKCEDCQKIVLDKEGKPITYANTCLSPFCKNPACQDNRIRISYQRIFKTPFKHKLLQHLIFGFSRTKFVKKQELRNQIKIMKEWFKEMEKLGYNLSGIYGRDFSGPKKDIYVHYHGAFEPLGDLKKLIAISMIARKKVMDKTGAKFTARWKPVRRKKGLLRYIAHRLAGILGDLRDRNKWYGFQDLMHIDDYAGNIYRQKRIFSHLLALPKAETYVPYMLNNRTEKCPFCSSKNLKFVLMMEKPPPDTKKCSVCGLNCVYEDFCIEDDICKWCRIKQINMYAEKNPDFLKFLKLQASFEYFYCNSKVKPLTE